MSAATQGAPALMDWGGEVVGYALIGVAALLVVVWLALAYFRVQWDQWEVIAQQSPRPWVRRALRRRGIRALVLVLMEAFGFE